MRLELNNSGSWKLVLTDVAEDQLLLVKAACLMLCAAGGQRMTWRLTETSSVHPGGQVVEHCIGGRWKPWPQERT